MKYLSLALALLFNTAMAADYVRLGTASGFHDYADNDADSRYSVWMLEDGRLVRNSDPDSRDHTDLPTGEFDVMRDVVTSDELEVELESLSEYTQHVMTTTSSDIVTVHSHVDKVETEVTTLRREMNELRRSSTETMATSTANSMAYTDVSVSRLDRKLSAGIAASAAIAALPDSNFGIGAGSYNGRAALALGVYGEADQLSGRLSIGVVDSSGPVIAVGFGFNFK